jgi:serine/threonine-protein kinase
MHDDAAEKGLRFGLLAVQSGYLSGETLAEALGAWARDPETPFSEIVRQRGAISGEQQTVIDSLVREQSVQAIVTRALDGATLAHADYSPAGGAVSLDGSRFRVLRPHARGGLGVVSVALDAELRREVALKEIRPEHADDPISRARFLLEAEITGRLEHPGIVPVYGLGADSHGRPYYAMRFVRGESLNEAADRFHEADRVTSRDPGERTLALRTLLTRFVAVCEAVAYAHSRGVIHRDLKPANILLGPYGETLLVDWGLAKIVGGDAPLDALPEELPSGSAADSSATQPGSALGTPSYMSPEQADGRLADLGPASDVYSLGATLYHLLAGVAPVAETNVAIALRRVRAADIPPPRSISPRVPQPLDAVVRRAMAARPSDRYASPIELAREIEHWLADEPVTAWREPWTTRARRMLSRHRSLAIAVAAAALALLIALGAIAVIQDAANRSLAGKNRELRLANAVALAARKRAEASDRQARAAVDEYLTQVAESKLLDVPGLQPLRKDLLETALRYYQNFLRQQGSTPGLEADTAHAYQRLGLITRQIDGPSAALSHFHQAHLLQQRLAAAQPESRQTQRDLAVTENAIGWVRHDLADYRDALRWLGAAESIRARLAAADPANDDDARHLASDLRDIGVVRSRAGDYPGAVEAHRQALAIRINLARKRPALTRDQGNLANSYFAISSALVYSGRQDESAEMLTHAYDLYRDLAQKHPTDLLYASEAARCQANLAYIARTRGQTDLARRLLEEAVATCQRLAAENPRVTKLWLDLGTNNLMLSDVERQQGRLDDSLASAERGRAVFERLRAEDSQTAQYVFDLGKCWSNIGRIHAARGEPALALAAFRQSAARYESTANRAALDEYNLACNLALSAALLDGADRDAAARRAVAAVRRSIAGGFRDIELFRGDSDLDSLRARPDFRALIADLAFPTNPFAR